MPRELRFILDSFSMDVCDDFVIVFKKYHAKSELYKQIILEKMDTITSMYPDTSKREKRQCFH